MHAPPHTHTHIAAALRERLEAKLEAHPGQLTRACVELAKEWRTEKYLRRLEAVMLVVDRDVSLTVTGIGACSPWAPPAPP